MQALIPSLVMLKATESEITSSLLDVSVSKNWWNVVNKLAMHLSCCFA